MASQNYRCSRSDIGSTSSTNDDPDHITQKYKKYKEMCKTLILENDELKQKNTNLERKLEIESFKVNDLEIDNLKLTTINQELEKSLENQKVDYTKKIESLQKCNKDSMKLKETAVKDLVLAKNLNTTLGKEIVTLTLQTEELTLSKNCSERTLKELKKLYEEKEIANKQSKSWCAKHSSLALIKKKLNIKTIEDKVEIDLALKQQKYWSKNNEIKCCVYDRKTGVDKHTTPPTCWLEYMKNCPPSNNNVLEENDVFDKDQGENNFNFNISDDE